MASPDQLSQSKLEAMYVLDDTFRAFAHSLRYVSDGNLPVSDKEVEFFEKQIELRKSEKDSISPHVIALIDYVHEQRYRPRLTDPLFLSSVQPYFTEALDDTCYLLASSGSGVLNAASAMKFIIETGLGVFYDVPYLGYRLNVEIKPNGIETRNAVGIFTFRFEPKLRTVQLK